MPEMSLARLRGILDDARTKRVALITRESVYPWRRKAYWVVDGTGLRANFRPTDSVQLLLHAADEVAGPARLPTWTETSIARRIGRTTTPRSLGEGAPY
jgi:hypothetical protein